MSSRIPFPEHAPAASPSCRVHRDVVALVGVRRLFRLFAMRAAVVQAVETPVRGSINTRGLETIFASCGAASGTLITSMRNSAVFGSLSGVLARAAGQLFALADKRSSRNVDVDVVLVVRIDHQRVRVRAAAGLHRRHLLRIFDVGDVENSHSAEAIFLRRRRRRLVLLFPLAGGGARRKSLRTAIQPAVRHLHRHEQQILVNRNVALPARTHHRRQQTRLRRSWRCRRCSRRKSFPEQMIALKRKIGVGKGELRSRQLMQTSQSSSSRRSSEPRVFCTFGSSGLSEPSWNASGFFTSRTCLMPIAASPAS